MPHILENELSQVRRRVRLLVVLHALAWVVGGLVAALLVFGLADYLIHFQDVGIRLMCSFMVLNVVVLTVSRYLWPALRTELGDVDLAMRVESALSASQRAVRQHHPVSQATGGRSGKRLAAAAP